MKRSDYMLAALASAVLPNLGVAGVRENVQASATDEAKGIDQTVIQDASGKLYDVYATNTKEGRTRLIRRVKAAQTLAATREPGGLGFDMDRVVAFAPGDVSRPGQTATAQAVGQQTQAESTPLTPRKPGPTGETTVMIAVHRDGQARPLDLLTLDDCAAVGTAIGAIHRLPSTFLANAKYPVVTTGQIRSQLTAWIRRLRSAGHVPQEITDSWARIMDTEGLWSFSTCTVHGGFSDGDFLFSGSTITTVTNWQDMQVNDPARDLAWIFGKLDESHRNAVLSAYGRMMGSRLDDLIMLRANLWLQMEQVGEFIQALNRADNDHIMQFKAQVERLAHQLGVIKHTPAPAPAAGSAAASSTKPGLPSTITVGTLLQDDRHQAPAQPQQSDTGIAAAEVSDDTPDPDRTGSADIVAAGDVDLTPEVEPDADRTANHPQTNVSGIATGTGSTKPQPSHGASHSSVTITLKELLSMNGHSGTTSTDASPASQSAAPTDDAVNDDTPDSLVQYGASSAQTTVIPLLEREERALRDARAGLDGYDSEGNPLAESSTSSK